MADAHIEDVAEAFAEVVNASGYISRRDFDNVVASLGGTSVEHLFDIFDRNGDGRVDYTELITGLTVLCGGNRDDKAAMAFHLQDYDGDGYIS